MFHRGEPLTETVWEKLMLGLSTSKYGQAVRERGLDFTGPRLYVWDGGKPLPAAVKKYAGEPATIQCASAPPADATAEDAGQSPCDRVGVLDCGAGF